jgi:hypothetical protein
MVKARADGQNVDRQVRLTDLVTKNEAKQETP